MNRSVFLNTFYESERETAQSVLNTIIGQDNAKNTKQIALELGYGLGVVRAVIRRSKNADLIIHLALRSTYYVDITN